MVASDQDGGKARTTTLVSTLAPTTPALAPPATQLNPSRVEALATYELNEISRKALGANTGKAPRLGVDAVDVKRLARELGSPIGADFKLRIFTASEIADCRDQVSKYATRWAVKEAVSKAIGTGFRQGLHASQIEVITAPDGSIRVAPTAGHRWPHDADTWAWTVSASHEGNVAVATAIALLP